MMAIKSGVLTQQTFHYNLTLSAANIGFAAMLADGITIGCISLSAAVRADVVLFGFCA